MSVEPSADADTIKTAFRREIARYHPDKVIHLGLEFQEMASTRAAELTLAYKTLSDPAAREHYDAGVVGIVTPPVAEPTPSPPPHDVRETLARPASESDHADVQTPADSRRRFAGERADRDNILRRAIAEKVRAAVESAFGTVAMPVVKGFETVLVPLAKPRFLGRHPPRVLVRAVAVVDAASIADAWNAAARTKVHVGKSPVVVLLVGRQLARPRELDMALEAASRQRKPDDGPGELVVVVVNATDWKYHLPAEVPATIRKLVDQICK